MKSTLPIVTALSFFLAAPLALANPEVPGAPQKHPVALVGGTVHPVSGPAIENGVIVFDAGKIVAVGRDAAIPADAERVDVSGKHVYPGLIDANSQLGLVEVPSVRGSRDQSEMGEINPNVKAHVAFNPDSELIPVNRSGGVLAVLTVPSGGLITGMSSCMLLDGWTWEDMCLKPGVGLHVNWPQMAPIEAWWIEQAPTAQLESRDRSLKAIRAALTDARAYQAAKKAAESGHAAAPEHDARWEAMIPALEKQMPAFIHAEDVQQIQSAVAFAEREGLRPVIVGGYDAPECAALLRKHNVPVVVGGVYRLPRRRADAYDAAYTVPARLHEAGVAFCIAGAIGGSSGALPANLRNLPHHAGTAAAYGLPPDEALKAITLYPAQIMGVADRLGSLEAGKDATLIVTTGDPLEIPTQVTAAYIQGRAVQLSDRQKRLWEKYKEKYRRLGIGG
ncbi:MAG: amidohydrolase family protein [Planctomycetia bacterium]|nr:amidohydrolase family protein [Planctomycetia bacterium]